MKKRLFGILPDGTEVYGYTICGGETEAEIITYGAAVRTLVFDGTDIAGGFDGIDGYITDTGNQGGTIGRVANRIENACFVMDGKEYALTQNDGKHCLHGGGSFNHRVWSVTSYSENEITLFYASPDGENGFPSELDASVTYTVAKNALIIRYSAVPKGKTPVSLTNHTYFNLNGLGGDIKEHRLKIWAEKYTETDSELIPTGNRPTVAGTRFDFREARKIGDGIDGICGGYDNNFILSPQIYGDFLGSRLGLAAQLECGGKRLSVYTDAPGLQLYTGNFLDGTAKFKGDIPAIKHGALCLETQAEPNSVKRGESIYRAGEVYKQTCVYKIERTVKK